MDNKFNLMILCDDPQAAKEAQTAEIDRIFYDLEFIGKAERQRNRNTVKSTNKIEDLSHIRSVISKSELLVRTNPIHAYSKEEINKIIDLGGEILMLPMVTDLSEVEQFIEFVNGRAKTCIMIETAQSLVRLDKIIATEGVDEIFIGLNDLHISMGLTFMFELLSGGVVEYISLKCNERKIPFGFGGIARIGEGDLPSDYILGEHVRLNSQSVILSRTFKGISGIDSNSRKIDLIDEVKKVRKKLNEIYLWSDKDFSENIKKVSSSVDKIVASIQKKI